MHAKNSAPFISCIHIALDRVTGHLTAYAGLSSREICGMPGKSQLPQQTPCVHEYTQCGTPDPPRMPQIKPLAWHPRRVTNNNACKSCKCDPVQMALCVAPTRGHGDGNAAPRNIKDVPNIATLFFVFLVLFSSLSKGYFGGTSPLDGCKILCGRQCEEALLVKQENLAQTGRSLGKPPWNRP